MQTKHPRQKSSGDRKPFHLAFAALLAGVFSASPLRAAETGTVPLSATGYPSPEFLREMLDDARTVVPTAWQPAPEGATDLRLYRIQTRYQIGEGLVFKGGVEQ